MQHWISSYPVGTCISMCFLLCISFHYVIGCLSWMHEWYVISVMSMEQTLLSNTNVSQGRQVKTFWHFDSKSRCFSFLNSQMILASSELRWCKKTGLKLLSFCRLSYLQVMIETNQHGKCILKVWLATFKRHFTLTLFSDWVCLFFSLPHSLSLNTHQHICTSLLFSTFQIQRLPPQTLLKDQLPVFFCFFFEGGNARFEQTCTTCLLSFFPYVLDRLRKFKREESKQCKQWNLKKTLTSEKVWLLSYKSSLPW